MSIAENFAAAYASIADAATASGRSRSAVTLVAVSKFQPAESVLAALATGHRVFGENRVQEALEKFAPLRPDYSDIDLHLIGPLQTNKVREAVDSFDVIQTIDRPKLAQSIATAFERPTARTNRVLIQVNTGEEPQKAGILPLEADDFIRDCIDRLHLPVVGLMCIPPADEEPALHFALLRSIALRHGLQQLSMGMSGDFPIAIQQGATHVRLGTALFGARDRD
jgi:pyridoxal phosphate enzyme (YggS family)